MTNKTVNPVQNGMKFNKFENAVEQALFRVKRGLDDVNQDIKAFSKDGNKVAAVFDTGGCGKTFYVLCISRDVIEGQELWHVDKTITIDPSGDGVDAMCAADMWINHP